MATAIRQPQRPLSWASVTHEFKTSVFSCHTRSLTRQLRHPSHQAFYSVRLAYFVTCKSRHCEIRYESLLPACLYWIGTYCSAILFSSYLSTWIELTCALSLTVFIWYTVRSRSLHNQQNWRKFAQFQRLKRPSLSTLRTHRWPGRCCTASV